MTVSDSAKKSRPVLKWTLIVCLGLLIALLLLAIAARWYATTDSARAMVEARLEALEIRGVRIEVEALEGDLLGDLAITRLSLHDSDGKWATAEGVRASWSPMSLLSGRLKVKELLTDSVVYLRDPIVTAPQPSTDSGSGFISAYQFERVSIGDIEINDAALGDPVRATFEARLVFTEQLLDADLELESRAREGDYAKLNVDWDRAGAPVFAFSLKGEEQGILARLLQLGDAQSIDGQGRFSADDIYAPDGQGEIRVNGETLLAFTVTPAGERVSVSIEAEPALHPDFPKALRPLGTVFIDANVNARALMNGPAISARGDSVTANAQLDEAGKWVFEARVENPSRFAPGLPFRAEDASISGQLDLETRSIANGNFRLTQARYSDVAVATVDTKFAVRESNGGYAAEIETGASGLDLNMAQAPERLDLKAVVTYADQIVQIKTGALRAAGAEIDFAGEVNVQDTPVLDLDGTFFVQRQFLEIDPVRETRAKWAVSGDLQEALSLSLNGDMQLEEAMELVGRTIDYDIKVQRSASGEILLERLAADAGRLTVLARGNFISAERFSGELQANVPAFTYADIALTEADANLKFVTTPQAGVKANGQIDVAELVRGDQKLQNLQIAFDDGGGIEANALSTQINIDAIYDQEPINADMRLSADLKERFLQITDLNAAWTGLTASGAAQLPFDAYQDAQITLDIGGQSDALSFIDNVDAQLRLKGRRLASDVVLSGLSLGQMRDTDLRFTANGDLDQVTGNLDVSGALALIGTSNPFELSGPWRIDAPIAPTRALELDVSGKVGPLEVATQAPLRVSVSDNGRPVGGVQLRLNQGTVNIAMNEAGSERLRVAVDKLPLSPLLQMIGALPRAGMFNADIRLSDGASDVLTGGGRFALEGLRSNDGAESSFTLTGQLKLTKASGLNLRLDETGLDDLRFTAEATYPVSVNAQRLQVSPLTGMEPVFSADIAGRIDSLAELFLPASINVAGDVRTNLRGRITPDGAVLDGNIKMSDGELQHVDLGLNLIDINADVGLNQDAVTIRSLRAKGASGGTVSGAGQYTIGALSQSSSEIDVNNLVIFDQDVGKARASGTVRLDSVDSRPTLMGDLSLKDAVFDIEKLPKAGPPTLDVSFKDKATDADQADDAGIVGIDLSVKADRNIRMTGRGVDARLSLDIALTEQLVSPQIGGSVRIDRGRFELLGKRFELVPSTMQIAQPMSQSRLNINAEREDRGFTYTISITGTVERPEINLSSTPELPEDEVLSRVLFGRSPSQLSAFEAAQLGAAIAQLSGGGGFDLLGGLQEQLGLDDLQLGVNETGAASLITGKYLAENVYVEVNTGLNGTPGLSIEWEPLENIEVEVETVPDEGQALSIQWKRDFD